MKVSLVEVLIVLTIILLFVGGIGAALLMPKFEKDAFNKFRDPNEPKATYWDAADPNYNWKKTWKN